MESGYINLFLNNKCINMLMENSLFSIVWEPLCGELTLVGHQMPTKGQPTTLSSFLNLSIQWLQW